MTRFIATIVFLSSVLVAGLCYAQAPISGTRSPELSVEQRLERLERILQSQGLLDMFQQMQQLQQEISNLRGEIETQNYNLELLTRRQRDLYTDVDQRMQRLEQTGLPEEVMTPFSVETDPSAEPPLETLTASPSFANSSSTLRTESALQVEIVNAGSTPQANEPGFVNEPAIIEPSQASEAVLDAEISPVTTTQVVTIDPVQLQAEYQQAFNLLRQSLYDQAIRAFQQFLALHPNDKYSDNAQYWLAEAFYVKREFEQALMEYNNVVNNFPQSQKANDAYLKIGFTLYEMGEVEPAKTQLQELIDNLPGTTVARLADERLQKINSAAPNTPPVSE